MCISLQHAAAVLENYWPISKFLFGEKIAEKEMGLQLGRTLNVQN